MAFVDENNAEIHQATINFPVTKLDIHKELETAGIRYTEIASEVIVKSIDLGEDYSGIEEGIVSEQTDINELNYLCAKLAALDDDNLDKFHAVIESGRHIGDKGIGCGAIVDMINIIENLNNFTYHSGFEAEDYGEYLLAVPDNMIDPLMRKLQSHAWIVECLRECADAEQFGRAMSYNNNGEFLQSGYLIEEGRFQLIYHGVLDIPEEYRLLGFEETSAKVMVQETDLSALLLGMHAACGDYMRDSKYNVSALNGSDDFFVVDTGNMLIVSPADSLYYDDTYEHGLWQSLTDSSDIKAYIMSVEGRKSGQITGSIYEAEVSAIQISIQKQGITLTHIDAEMKDGSKCSFSHTEWKAMDPIERDQVIGWDKHYDHVEKAQISALVSNMRFAYASINSPMSPHDFLHKVNEPYMNQAANKKSGMLRITLDAARELLAQNVIDVFRMTPKGTEKLSPLDAVKTGLWYSFDREFAIKPDDLKGFEKWAQCTAGDFLRQSERGGHKKEREESL